ncbi:MAG: extracellular solute-binding protein [Candidatus Paceibacterota bacterium]
METKSKFFQLGVLFFFGTLAVLGVLFFAGIGGFGGSKERAGPVEIWGTAPRGVMNEIIGDLRRTRDDFDSVEYVEKNPATYYQEFVEALASGTGPDLFMLDQDEILQHENKAVLIPYDNYPQRDFRNTFIQEGELYATTKGIIALPFSVDPLVMYWNRTLFQSAGIANPPEFWDEFLTLAPRLTQRDQAFNIIKSAVALGEYQNVRHAKEILTTLLFQAGTPIINSNLEVVLDEQFSFSTKPSHAALRFYTEFADPVRDAYSWNRALPESRQAFISGDLAVYFGFASELEGIRNANPNLNFDVAFLPQSRDSGERLTFGSMRALAISRQSENPGGALVVAEVLTSPEVLARYEEFSGLPPVRRDMLAQKTGIAHKDTFYDSALVAQAWLDPNPITTDTIFKDMVESVLSGSLRISDAVRTADSELANTLR